MPVPVPVLVVVTIVLVVPAVPVLDGVVGLAVVIRVGVVGPGRAGSRGAVVHSGLVMRAAGVALVRVAAVLVVVPVAGVAPPVILAREVRVVARPGASPHGPSIAPELDLLRCCRRG
jgi:hypothetical protein